MVGSKDFLQGEMIRFDVFSSVVGPGWFLQTPELFFPGDKPSWLVGIGRDYTGFLLGDYQEL